MAIAGVAVGVAVASIAQTGCDVEGRAFRSAALPAVKTGASQILNGLLDGFFAAVAPEPTTGTTSNTTSKK